MSHSSPPFPSASRPRRPLPLAFAESPARAGSARPLLVGLLVAAAALVLWMLSLLVVDPDAGATVLDVDQVDHSSAATPGGATEALVAPDRPTANIAVNANSRGANTGRTRTAQRTRIDADELTWIEGRIILPDGTPLDEHVVVESRERGSLTGARDRSPIDAQGRFRVAFSKDTKVGWLRVKGRYVWFPGSISVRPGKTPPEELQLEVILGGRIEGTLSLVGSGAFPTDEIKFNLNGSPDAEDQRERVYDANVELIGQRGESSAHFAGNALPPGLYTITCSPEGFLSREAEEFRVSAGETSAIDLELVSTPTLVGTVLDPKGEPVEGADVSVMPHGAGDDVVQIRRRDETDGDGRFVLRGVFPGEVKLYVYCDGFEHHEEGFDVRDRAQGEELQVVLSFGRTLSGRVVYADGKPAGGARVTARAARDMKFRASFDSEGSRSTDADEEGRFFLSALGEGPFEVLSSTPQPQGEGFLVGILEDVQVNSEDLLLTLGPGFTITGRVVDLSGQPLRRFALSVRPQGLFAFLRDPGSVGLISQRVRDKQGRFQVEGLLPGTWDFNVVAGGYSVTEKLVLQLPPQPAELTIEMFRLSTLKGRVLGPDGRPVPKAEVSYQKQDGGFDMNSFGSRQTNRKGQFRFSGVSPGTIRISASADGFAPARDMVIEVEREVSRDDILLTLGRGATIEGLVVDANGVPRRGAMVTWHNTERDQSGAMRVGKEGRFRAAGVPAGPITLNAQIPFLGSDGVSKGSRTVSLERVLAEGDVWSPVLRDEVQTLNPTRIEVRRNGDPWGDIKLALTRDRWSMAGKTDEQGLVTLDLPGAGEYGFALRRSSVHIAGTCQVDSSWRLRFDFPVGAVQGTVATDTKKTPLFVSVKLKPTDPESSPYQLSARDIRVSDKGEFNADGILAGTYTIQAVGPTSDRTLLQSAEHTITVDGSDRTLSIDLVIDHEAEFSGEFNPFENF